VALGEHSSARSAAASYAARGERFSRLIRIDIRHEYEGPADGITAPCMSLEMRPTPQTSSRLARFGLLLRPRADGIDILSSDRQDERFRKTLTEERADLLGMGRVEAAFYFGPPLLFTMTPRGSDFLRFTDLPPGFGSGQASLWLSNGLAMSGLITAARWRKSGFYRNAHPKIEPPRDSHRRGEGDEPAAASQNRSFFLGKGGYSSQSDVYGGFGERRGYRSGGSPLPLAMFDIHLTRSSAELQKPQRGSRYPIDLQLERVVADPDRYLTPVDYCIGFAARRTRWRYIVAPRGPALDCGSLTITAADGSPSDFRRVKPPPHVPAHHCCFAARKVRTLRRRGTTDLILKGTSAGSNGRVRTLIDPLPAPDPGALALEGARIWSDTYLFV
jgi:hypothetical protein